MRKGCPGPPSGLFARSRVGLAGPGVVPACVVRQGGMFALQVLQAAFMQSTSVVPTCSGRPADSINLSRNRRVLRAEKNAHECPFRCDRPISKHGASRSHCTLPFHGHGMTCARVGSSGQASRSGVGSEKHSPSACSKSQRAPSWQYSLLPRTPGMCYGTRHCDSGPFAAWACLWV